MISNWLPVTFRPKVGSFLARLAYLVGLRRRKKIAMQNLLLAFPDRSEDERTSILKESVLNLGRGLFELLALGGDATKSLLDRVDIEGLHHLREAQNESPTGGVIALTAHLGNWEILAAFMHAHGLEISVVQRGRDNASFDRFINRLRSHWGVELLTRGNAARGALRAIRDGKILAVPLDQNCSRKEGVFVPFFGHLACTRDGPARLAMATGAPVVPCYIERIDKTHRHRVRILPSLDMIIDEDRSYENVAENVRRMTSSIEDAIALRPEQWIWMHKRWHTQPEGHPRPYSSTRKPKGKSKKLPYR